MRDLQHIGPQVYAGAEQRVLRLDLRVAGQQDTHAVDDGTQDERGVVRVGAGVVEGGRRSQHVEVHGTDVEMRADRRTQDGQSAWPGDLVDDVHARRRIGERAGQDVRDASAAHHAGQPRHVVQMEVRDHEQRDLADAEIAQAAVDCHRIRAGVDLHCRARCGGQQ